jgi:chromosome segregation ATPase
VILPPSPPLIEELRAALAAAERRVEELNERARIADAERGVAVGRVNAENAQLREQLVRQLEALNTVRGRLDAERADLPALSDDLFARGDRIAALERELAVRADEIAGVRASLVDSERRALGLDADIVNLRAAIARRDAQIATLEADLVARQAREAALRTRLDEALASASPQMPDLRAAIAAREERIRVLEAALAAAQAQVADKNADLEVAEESIRHLEMEVRDKAGKLDEANVTVEEWRAVIAESQRSIQQRDFRIHQLEADLEKKLSSTLDTAAQTGEEIALEGPARVLIRTDGNTDFVHVLGRRTRIGRGSDNELVLDTKHVSRYHAVLLAGPVHTSIEDLNSTNGVFVNGKRVARQVLKDGDRVTIGRSHFRYTVRT